MKKNISILSLCSHLIETHFQPLLRWHSIPLPLHGKSKPLRLLPRSQQCLHQRRAKIELAIVRRPRLHQRPGRKALAEKIKAGGMGGQVDDTLCPPLHPTHFILVHVHGE